MSGGRSTTVAGERRTSARLGVRWGRASVINLAGFGIVAWLAFQVLTAGTIFGLGGAGLVMQGSASQFSTAKLSTSNVGFGMVPISLKKADGSTATKYALRMGFAAGSLDGFCMSQTKSLLGSDFTIRLTAGGHDLNVTDVSGKNVQFDVTSARSSDSPNTSGNGIALRGNVALGVASQSLTTWQDSTGKDAPNPLDAPEDFAGKNGRLFGIDSDVGDLYNLKGTIYDAVIQGPLTIKNLKIEVLHASEAKAGCQNIDIAY